MDEFTKLLFQTAQPLLEKLGYRYDEAMGHSNILYGFRKSLKDDIHIVIRFQRFPDEDRDVAAEMTFNVMTSRGKSTRMPNIYSGRYEGVLGGRLASVLWNEYGLRLYQHADNWWPETREGLEDALDKLERYAIPWLENPKSRYCRILSKDQINEFKTRLQTLVFPALTSMGYEIQAGSDMYAQPYARKNLTDGVHAFILFNPVAFKGGLGFDVLMFRKRSPDPFDQSWLGDEVCFEAWAKWLFPQQFGFTISPEPPGVWRYKNTAELDAQLHDALTKLSQHVIPWLENLTSRPLLSFQSKKVLRFLNHRKK